MINSHREYNVNINRRWMGQQRRSKEQEGRGECVNVKFPLVYANYFQPWSRFRSHWLLLGRWRCVYRCVYDTINFDWRHLPNDNALFRVLCGFGWVPQIQNRSFNPEWETFSLGNLLAAEETKSNTTKANNAGKWHQSTLRTAYTRHSTEQFGYLPSYHADDNA